MTLRAIAAAAALTTAFAAPAFAADVAAGEKAFAKCKSCHMIAEGDDVVVKGGKTGPNLYGIVGRTAGTVEGFKYGDSLEEAGKAGLVWTQEAIAEYVKDPKAFLAKTLGDDKVKSKMAYKLRDGGEDVAAYLASVGGGS